MIQYAILNDFMKHYPDIQVYTLPEFMEAYNNEDYETGDFWLSYITVGS